MLCDETSLQARVPEGRLYHGTVDTYGELIVSSGILQPRAATKIAVTEKTGQKYLDSDESMVYLSTVSALTYAYSQAVQDRGAGNEAACPCVIEISMSSLAFGNLYPDEDFVAVRMLQGELGLSASKMPPDSHEDRLAKLYTAAKAQREAHQDLVCESVDVLGSLAHKGPIQLSAITRITIMQDPNALSFLDAANDAMSTQRSQFGLNSLERQLGRLLTRWFIGEPVRMEEFPAEMRQSAGQKTTLANRLAMRPTVLYQSSSKSGAVGE
ncbi:MAG: hypothetical protein O7D91_03160 [Planctomycetota bacterium]|nr:hypothetical protein [Planctomycetota bacterium]